MSKRRAVPFGHAHQKTTCNPCGGTGQVLVDPNDARKGTKTCTNCNGEGEV